MNRPAEVLWGTFSAIFPEVVLMLARVAGFICHLPGFRDFEPYLFQQSSYVVVATD